MQFSSQVFNRKILRQSRRNCMQQIKFVAQILMHYWIYAPPWSLFSQNYSIRQWKTCTTTFRIDLFISQPRPQNSEKIIVSLPCDVIHDACRIQIFTHVQNHSLILGRSVAFIEGIIFTWIARASRKISWPRRGRRLLGLCHRLDGGRSGGEGALVDRVCLVGILADFVERNHVLWPRDGPELEPGFRRQVLVQEVAVARQPLLQTFEVLSAIQSTRGLVPVWGHFSKASFPIICIGSFPRFLCHRHFIFRLQRFEKYVWFR